MPRYVIDEAALVRNLEILKGVSDRTGVKILLAQKAFSCAAVYPLCAKYLAGTTAQLTEQIRPSRLPGRSPVGAVVEYDRKLLPWEQWERNVLLTDLHVVAELIRIYVDILSLKAILYMLYQQMLLLTTLVSLLLYYIDPFPDFLRKITSLHHPHQGQHQA